MIVPRFLLTRIGLSGLVLPVGGAGAARGFGPSYRSKYDKRSYPDAEGRHLDWTVRTLVTV
ncbi:MAG: hypothetical protein JO283_12530 [Bradyrhizobium sp.]|nr:hypothetical protein [Bradyrhizobium sp.]